MIRIKLLFLLLFVGLGLKAQEVSSQEDVQKKKEINQIKLGEQAVYAEVVELASDDYEAVSLAQQRSINKLQANVIEACAKKMNMSKEDVKEIFDVIDDKCQNVVIKKGDMLRVFSYITKDAIGLGRKKPKQEDIDEIFGPEAVGTEVASVENQAVKSQVSQSVEPVIPAKNIQPVTTQQVQTEISQPTQPVQPVSAQPVKSVTSQPAQPVQPVVKQSVQPSQPVQPAVSQPVEPVQAAPVTTPAVTPVPVEASAPAPAPVAEVSVPALCQTMISKGNMNELMRYLSQEKRYQRLMFGNSTSMQYPDKCYVVIIDKSTRNIVSVLDKGQTERMNFITKKMDRYSNYRGGNKYAAIFVQEY